MRRATVFALQASLILIVVATATWFWNTREYGELPYRLVKELDLPVFPDPVEEAESAIARGDVRVLAGRIGWVVQTKAPGLECEGGLEDRDDLLRFDEFIGHHVWSEEDAQYMNFAWEYNLTIASAPDFEEQTGCRIEGN